MNKKIWKRICISSVILLLLSVGSIIGMYAKAMLSIPNEPQVSIIGGADYPTAAFVINAALFHSPLFSFLLSIGILALLVCIVSGFMLIRTSRT